MSEQHFVLTEQHLNLLRELVFEWDQGEAGAPLVFPGWQYGSADLYGDMGRILSLKIEGSQISAEEKASFDQLNKDLPLAFEIALQQSTLQPGPYSYTKVSPSYDEDDDSPVENTIVFDFTEAHLKLLRGANGGKLDYAQTLGINSKRPYGDMTSYELDMAHLLGIPVPYDDQKQVAFSREQQTQFDQLHQDLLHSVPVLLKHGTLRVGPYYRASSYGAWQFAEEVNE